MKIASIVGARPQFIKAAPLDRELRKHHEHLLIHTGQHYDYLMSAVFFEELGIPEPDYNLGVGSASHARQTGEMLIRIEETLTEERPGCVLVYGDTNSTLAGALAAAKLHLQVAHVEAGLRSLNRAMPEEINRVLTDHIADLLFCPTETARHNLAREGIKKGVFKVGDVMYDAVRYSVDVVERRSHILSSLKLQPRSYLLATIHRPSNTDNTENLSGILAAFNALGEDVVFPAHPRTSQAIGRAGCQLSSRVQMVEPVSYLDMLALEKNARLILTDSGGVQKEAYFFGVPCITLREETEWVETTEAGWNVLVGTSKAKIIQAVQAFQPHGRRPAIFGDGKASQKIVRLLESMNRS
jgi:UDP-N-acetylglucosamine 2-epimerase